MHLSFSGGDENSISQMLNTISWPKVLKQNPASPLQKIVDFSDCVKKQATKTRDNENEHSKDAHVRAHLCEAIEISCECY